MTSYVHRYTNYVYLTRTGVHTLTWWKLACPKAKSVCVALDFRKEWQLSGDLSPCLWEASAHSGETGYLGTLRKWFSNFFMK